MLHDFHHDRWKYGRYWYTPFSLEVPFIWRIHSLGHVLGSYTSPCPLDKVQQHCKLYSPFVYKKVHIHCSKYSSAWEVSSKTRVLFLFKVSLAACYRIIPAQTCSAFYDGMVLSFISFFFILNLIVAFLKTNTACKMVNIMLIFTVFHFNV